MPASPRAVSIHTETIAKHSERGIHCQLQSRVLRHQHRTHLVRRPWHGQTRCKVDLQIRCPLGEIDAMRCTAAVHKHRCYNTQGQNFKTVANEQGSITGKGYPVAGRWPWAPCVSASTGKNNITTLKCKTEARECDQEHNTPYFGGVFAHGDRRAGGHRVRGRFGFKQVRNVQMIRHGKANR
jgi:hypothetical protein